MCTRKENPSTTNYIFSSSTCNPNLKKHPIEPATRNLISNHWYLSYALPIALVVYLIVNALMCVRFLKINKLLKTGLILFLSDIFAYMMPLFIKVDNAFVQRELDDINIFKADFSKWVVDATLEQNINCIVALSVLAVALIFFGFGMFVHLKKKNK